MDVLTALTGPFPRSEALVAATRDLDRGRTTPEHLEELFAAAEGEVVALEERLGFASLTGGYLRWQDLFRPFAEGWSGFTVGPVTRWFETNTFYRQPILHAPPERAPGSVARRLPVTPATKGIGRAKVILPGPYTFTGLLDNRSGETTEGLIHRFGKLLAEEVRELKAVGYQRLQFQEPLLVTAPPTGARAEAVVAAYASLAEAADGMTTLLWTFFGDASASPVLPRLRVNAIGVDLAETDAGAVQIYGDRKMLALGVVDPRTTLVEESADVAQAVRAIAARTKPASIFLGPGAPLDLLPWEPATRKLHALPAVRAALTEAAA